MPDSRADNPRQVAGQVIDAAGAPIPGALVTFATPIPFPEIAVRTDGDGRFVVTLPPAPFVLTAHIDDRHSADVAVAADALDAPPMIVR